MATTRYLLLVLVILTTECSKGGYHPEDASANCLVECPIMMMPRSSDLAAPLLPDLRLPDLQSVPDLSSPPPPPDLTSPADLLSPPDLAPPICTTVLEWDSAKKDLAPRSAYAELIFEPLDPHLYNITDPTWLEVLSFMVSASSSPGCTPIFLLQIPVASQATFPSTKSWADPDSLYIRVDSEPPLLRSAVVARGDAPGLWGRVYQFDPATRIMLGKKRRISLLFRRTDLPSGTGGAPIGHLIHTQLPDRWGELPVVWTDDTGKLYHTFPPIMTRATYY